jgi:mono/diheme cytochrome c family protein
VAAKPHLTYLALGLAAVAWPVQAAEPSFAASVLPVFQQRCLGCHTGPAAQAGLDLSTVAAVVKGGRSGAAVVAGDSGSSLLVAKVASRSMPPGEPKLTDAEIQAIRNWVDQGPELKAAAHGPRATERDVLAIFQMRCVVCHGKRKQEGGLDLRTRASRAKGGKSGPAFIPGKPEESLIVKRVAAGEMPPPKLLFSNSVRPASEAELEVLKQWIAAGGPPDQATPPDAGQGLVTEQDRQFWSFQPPRRPVVPQVPGTRPANPIDAFLLEKLAAKKLGFSPEADRATLLRRLSIAMLGLPPTPAEMAAFLNDRRPGAWERQVERVLASPHYGERWGRYWLDAVGYSDSEGKVDSDDIRPHAWRYRDYVIRSLNSDKPYDRFLAEQLAGDEMVTYQNGQPVTPETLEKLVATGFWRMAADGTYSPAQSFLPERMNVLADQIEVFGSAVLGLSINCARCHNHKYDPLPQRDYYRLSAILQTAYDPYDWVIPTQRHLDVAVEAEKQQVAAHNAPVEAEIKKLEGELKAREAVFRAQLLEERIAALPEGVRADVRALLTVEAPQRTAVQKYLADKFSATLTVKTEDLTARFPEYKAEAAATQKKLAPFKEKLWEKPQVRALYEMGGEPSGTYLLRRGDALSPAEPVEPGVPTVLSTGLKPYRTPAAGASGGRRLALAEWMTQPNHPLTARVIVNRIWMHQFGHGLVSNPANFGRAGTKPSHSELLDWLATELVAKGWSLKSIQRLILTSQAWRQSSQVSAAAAERDPANLLLSRMPLQRLDADALHDSILAVTGQLDATLGGRPAPIEVRPDGEVVPKGYEGQWRRAVYVLQRRRSPVTMLEVFDTPPMSPNCVERPKSTVPTQALTLMNGADTLGHARYLAGRLMDEPGTTPARQVEAAYARVLARAATAAEIAAGVAAISGFADRWRAELAARHDAAPQTATAAWMALGDFVHVLLNSAEFSYVD